MMVLHLRKELLCKNMAALQTVRVELCPGVATQGSRFTRALIQVKLP